MDVRSKGLQRVQVAFLAADASKTIVAAPGANKRIVVHRADMSITTSAAQAIDLEDTSGTVEVYKGGASLAVGTDVKRLFTEGMPLTINEAFIYKPAAAGPAGHIVCEYWIEPTVTF